ncbi:hypothetical protein [Actinopolymorpha pittospori]
MQATENADAKILVEIDKPPRTVGFAGRWLVEPNPDDAPARLDEDAAGTYRGIALTKRGRIALYAAHHNPKYPAVLTVYADLQALSESEDHVPPELLARAAAELNPNRTTWLDI